MSLFLSRGQFPDGETRYTKTFVLSTNIFVDWPGCTAALSTTASLLSRGEPQKEKAMISRPADRARDRRRNHGDVTA
jgi:hypothetical protein